MQTFAVRTFFYIYPILLGYMKAIDLLSDIVPSLHKDDTGTEALNWMDVFKVSHLPIVDKGNYIGLISDAEIFDMPNPDAPIMEQHHVLARPFVRDDKHIFDIMSLLSKCNISVVPVLDYDDKYLGTITLSDLSHEIAHLVSTDNPGAVIELELHVNDYSLSEIAQIVEGNDTKITSLYVREHQQHGFVYVTLKLNRTDVSSVIQTFERYSYKIVQVYSDDSKMASVIQDRYNSLMQYLSV